ncbi:MAG: cytochrome c [Vicinamibacterales bacterium]
MANGTVPAAAMWLAASVLLLSPASAASAQDDPGAKVYQEACAACHADNGRGQPQPQVGFDLPLPDFTDCTFTTREPDGDWFGVVHGGGPARGFDHTMPAFGEALSTEEIEAAVSHLRTFCTDDRWPRGELNLPRALVTEKAYPEDEAVVTYSADAEGAGAMDVQFVYEKRLGTRSQYEVALPFSAAQTGSGWRGGTGDLTFGVKHTLFSSLPRGTIFSLGGETRLPTGDAADGAGAGVGAAEGYLSFGQVIGGGDSFVQAQAGLEVPWDSARAAKEAFWRVVVGRTFSQHRYMRAWTPMVELLAARELEDDAATEWDAVPQMQISLSARQHVQLALGLRVPLSERERPTRFMIYLLWDWFDGGLLEGW